MFVFVSVRMPVRVRLQHLILLTHERTWTHAHTYRARPPSSPELCQESSLHARTRRGAAGMPPPVALDDERRDRLLARSAPSLPLGLDCCKQLIPGDKSQSHIVGFYLLVVTITVRIDQNFSSNMAAAHPWTWTCAHTRASRVLVSCEHSWVVEPACVVVSVLCLDA